MCRVEENTVKVYTRLIQAMDGRKHSHGLYKVNPSKGRMEENTVKVFTRLIQARVGWKKTQLRFIQGKSKQG